MKSVVCLLAVALVTTASALPKSTNRCANVSSGTIMPSLDCQFYVVCQKGQEVKLRCQPLGSFFDANRMVCDKRARVTCWDGVESSESSEETTVTDISTTVDDSSKESGENSSVETKTNRCKDVTSGTILSSRQCQFYVVCQRGQEVQVRCQPLGTFFDINRMVCDKRPRTDCTDITTTTTTTSTTTTTTTTEAPVTTEELTTTTTIKEIITEEVTPEEIITEESTTGEPVTTTAAPPKFAEMCRGVLFDVLPHPTDSKQFVICAYGRYQVQQCAEGQIFKTLVRACAL